MTLVLKRHNKALEVITIIKNNFWKNNYGFCTIYILFLINLQRTLKGNTLKDEDAGYVHIW